MALGLFLVQKCYINYICKSNVIWRKGNRCGMQSFSLTGKRKL